MTNLLLNASFNGWHLVKNNVSSIPWLLIFVPLVVHSVYMAIITSLSKSDFMFEGLLEKKAHLSLESSIWQMLPALLITGSLIRALDVVPITELGVILVSAAAFVCIVLITLCKISLKVLPYVYGGIIILISLLQTWYMKTPAFFVPTTCGVVFGYCFGLVDYAKWNLARKIYKR